MTAKSVITATQLLAKMRHSDATRAAKIMNFLDGLQAWHSVKSDRYHTHPKCTEGNNIEPENKRQGTGGKRKCSRCSILSLRVPPPLPRIPRI